MSRARKLPRPPHERPKAPEPKRKASSPTVPTKKPRDYVFVEEPSIPKRRGR